MAALSSRASYGPSPASPSMNDQQSIDSRSTKTGPSRQLLSCTKCRERKVKCDRTKPCTSCCARGHPKDCDFVIQEGNEYEPIQQSYEIRRLRQDNQRLQDEIRALRQANGRYSDDNDDSGDQSPVQAGPSTSIPRQRGFKAAERIDNLYFGTPGLASVVSEIASLQVGSHSLTHTIPRARDMYVAESSAYPFPAITTHSTSNALLGLLPPKEELLQYLDLFQRRAQSSSFPHVPEEITRREVERFLSDPVRNADKSPDMLALIFVTLATGLQMGQYDLNGGQWNSDTAESARCQGDAFLAASMQSLRNASFMNTPTLLGIQTLVMMGPYLTNSGRFLDAWTLFGTTIRLAQSIGLHRNPSYLDPVPSPEHARVRQTLWWWMLHMDAQYSITLGRPLGISGIGDCPPPQALSTDMKMRRLSEFIHHYTILSRQILASDGMMTMAKIDEFTDKLLGLWDTMPDALVYHEGWVDPKTPLPEWPLEVTSTTLFIKMQSLLILLNRQRPDSSPSNRSSRHTSPPNHISTNTRMHNAPIRGRALVITCCEQIVKAFMFFKHRNPAVLICWAMSQQTFNACMILMLDMWESEDEHNEWLLGQAYAVFRELEVNGVHTLAELAVQQISDGLVRIGQRREEREHQESMGLTMEGQAVHHQQRHQRHRHNQQEQQQHQHHIHPPSMAFNAAVTSPSTIPPWEPEPVMGNTGMFLLEDPGLQCFIPPPFEPLGWHIVGEPASSSSSTHLHHHQHHHIQQPSPISDTHHHIPVSDIVPAPFPLTAGPIDATSSPFAPMLGCLPYMAAIQPMPPPPPPVPISVSVSPTTTTSVRAPAMKRRAVSQTAFTPINVNVSGGVQRPVSSSRRGQQASHQHSPRQQRHLQQQQQRHHQLKRQ